MKKLLAALALVAVGTTASAQTYTPMPEVTQDAPSFSAGAGFGSMGANGGIFAAIALLVILGVIAGGDDDDNGSTTIFQ